MNKKTLSLAVIGVAVLPIIALAQIGGTPPPISIGLVDIGQEIAQGAWVVFTIIAVIMFVVAGILFLTAGGQPEKIAAARSSFIWGVAGVVVAILAFTIIKVVTSVIH